MTYYNDITTITCKEYDKNLILIDLDLFREGFQRFISSWVYRQGRTTILVDPGPRSTYPTLRRTLAQIGVGAIDAVLLTHIHIDHAGGCGLLLKDHPQAKVICHPRSFRHLIDPARLWSDSRKVLGTLAEEYGAIEPISESVLTFDQTVQVNDLEVCAIDTPGHAPHHLCFCVGKYLFTGEVAGVTYPLASKTYFRPATPAGGRIDLLQDSQKKAAGLSAEYICFGHYGLTKNSAHFWSEAAAQLALWLATVKKHITSSGEIDEQNVFLDLLHNDPLFCAFTDLPRRIQTREQFFVVNSIRGMAGYLFEQKTKDKN